MSLILDFQPSRLVYYAIPKVANTSIRRFLAPLLGIKDAERYRNIHQQVDWPVLSKVQARARKSDILGIAVTRNPYERLVSAYANKLRGPRLHKPLQALGFDQDMTFIDFVSTAVEIPDNETDVHLRSQWDLLTFNGEMLPDLIVDLGRIAVLESVTRDWVSAQGGPRLGEVGLSNVSGASLDTSHLFRDRAEMDHARNMISVRYARDLKAFGYGCPFRME